MFTSDDTPQVLYIREVFRRRRDEIERGVPAVDPLELDRVIVAFWNENQANSGSLVKHVLRKAAAARQGYSYQEAKDVSHDAMIKGCELLLKQYVNNDLTFRFDPDGKYSLATWMEFVVGDGFGESAGVLGTWLQKQRRDRSRLASLSDEEVSREAEMVRTPGGDPERACWSQELAQHLIAKLEKLEEKKRFALSALVLFRAGCIETFADVTREIEQLCARIWPQEDREQFLAIARGKWQLLEAKEVTESYIKDVVTTVVGISQRQFLRWSDSFFAGLRSELGGGVA